MIFKPAETSKLQETLCQMLADLAHYKSCDNSLEYRIQKRLNESINSYAAELDETCDTLAHFKTLKANKKIIENL